MIKRQPSFNSLKVKTTPEGMKLAHKFLDFLMFEVGQDIDVSIQDKYITEWAVCFDSHIIKHNDYDCLCELFDFYVSDWRNKRKRGEHPYVYVSPNQFLSDLYLLAQRREWSSCPILEEELADYLQILCREPWACSWESLVVAVSKSVYNFRRFFCGLRLSNLNEQLKMKIGHTFGDLRDYLVRHFMNWRYEKSESVWVITYTQDKIFDDVRKMLAYWGYGIESQQKFLESIKNAMKESENGSSNRDRPR